MNHGSTPSRRRRKSKTPERNNKETNQRLPTTLRRRRRARRFVTSPTSPRNSQEEEQQPLAKKQRTEEDNTVVDQQQQDDDDDDDQLNDTQNSEKAEDNDPVVNNLLDQSSLSVLSQHELSYTSIDDTINDADYVDSDEENDDSGDDDGDTLNTRSTRTITKKQKEQSRYKMHQWRQKFLSGIAPFDFYIRPHVFATSIERMSQGYRYDTKKDLKGNPLTVPSIQDESLDDYIQGFLQRKNNVQYGMHNQWWYMKGIAVKLNDECIVSYNVVKQVENFLLEMSRPNFGVEVNKSDLAFLDFAEMEEKRERCTIPDEQNKSNEQDENKKDTSDDYLLPALMTNQNMKLRKVSLYLRSLLQNCYWRSNYYVDIRSMWYPKCYDFIHSLGRFMTDGACAEHFLVCSEHFIFDARHKLHTLAVIKTDEESQDENNWRVDQTALSRMLIESKDTKGNMANIVFMLVDLMDDLFVRTPLHAQRFASTIGGLFDILMDFSKITGQYEDLSSEVALRVTLSEYPLYAVSTWTHFSNVFLDIMSEKPGYFVPSGIIEGLPDTLTIESFISHFSVVDKACSTTQQRQAVFIYTLGFITLLSRQGCSALQAHPKFPEFWNACTSFVERMKQWPTMKELTTIMGQSIWDFLSQFPPDGGKKSPQKKRSEVRKR